MTQDSLDISTCDSDYNTQEADITSVEEALEQYNSYIIDQIEEMVSHRSKIAHSAELDLEKDELIQKVRINLWDTLQNKSIKSSKAYIRHMFHNEYVNIVHGHETPLTVKESDKAHQYSSSQQDSASEQHHSASMKSIAVLSTQCGVSPYDDDPGAEEVFKEYDFVCIFTQVKRRGPLGVAGPMFNLKWLAPLRRRV